MKGVTLRLPDPAYDVLVRLCRKFGVSQRAVWEAATLVCLDQPGPDVPIWIAARHLDESGALRVAPRTKVVARMDDDLAARLTSMCRSFGVTVNAALGLVVLRWPDEDLEAFKRYRAENLDRIVDLARHLDHERRGGNPYVWSSATGE